MTTASNRSGVLIVGASQAGVQLAGSLRDLGWAEPITLVGAEKLAPYERPPLSKKALQNEGHTPESLQFRSEAFYADKGITLATGRRISRIEKDSDGSGVAFTDSGERFDFSRLALTVGARPRRLQIDGQGLDGVMYLRTLEDSVNLRERLRTVTEITIIGGGFIGLEVAATARQMGKTVNVVLANDRLMARAVGEHISDFFLDVHRRQGVEVHLATRPKALLDGGTGLVCGVELADGRVLNSDLVVIGIGAVPRGELAEQLGLDFSDGIVVDKRCLTSDGQTVAAGDCVLAPCPGEGSSARMRFESVSTAVEQAKVAAATIVGAPATYDAVPWFWSDQYTWKLQVVGLTEGYDNTVLRRSGDAGAFTVLYYRLNRLIAAECVNRPTDFLAARSALKAGRSISAQEAADITIPLKRLECEAPQFAASVSS